MLADTPAARAQMNAWLILVASDIAPCSGQAVHFEHFAPAPKYHDFNRPEVEAWRRWVRRRATSDASFHAGRQVHSFRHGRAGLGFARAFYLR